MSIDKALIGQRIRTARNLRGMKAAVLAEQTEITTESLGHIECGVRGPSLQTLIKISDALEVSLDYLVGKTQSPVDEAVHLITQEEQLTPFQKEMFLSAARSLLPFIKKYG